MNGVSFNFNAANVAPSQALDALPNGWQNVQITNSEQKPTSKGDGQMIVFEFTVLDGPYKGRKIFDQLCLVHPNPTTVEIAYKNLSAICHATNRIQIQQTTAEVHGIPMMIKLKKREARRTEDGKEYDANNEVKGYDKYGSDHELAHGTFAGGVAGAPQGTPSWANTGANAAPPAAGFPGVSAPGSFPGAPTPPATGGFQGFPGAGAPPAGPTPPQFNGAAGFPGGGAAPAQPWPQPGAQPGAPTSPNAAPAFPGAGTPPPPMNSNVPPHAPPQPVRVMTELARGATYEQCIASGWTDDALLQHGLMRWETPAPVSTAPAPGAFPGVPQPPAGFGQPTPPQLAANQPGGFPGGSAPWMHNG